MPRFLPLPSVRALSIFGLAAIFIAGTSSQVDAGRFNKKSRGARVAKSEPSQTQRRGLFARSKPQRRPAARPQTTEPERGTTLYLSSTTNRAASNPANNPNKMIPITTISGSMTGGRVPENHA